MSNQDHRGDRLHPSRFHRLYYHLTCLRRAYSGVLARCGGDWMQATLLDFGCGNMPYRPLFEPLVGEYVGSDLDGNDKAIITIQADGTLPLANESMDVVLSSQVLEHVGSPASYLAEAYRVLKPEGVLLLSTHGTWRYHPDPTDFWRWTCDGLRKQIEQSGFEIVHFEGVVGPAATAIQLFQDATGPPLPWPIRGAYYFFCQLAIGLFDRLQSKAARDCDASVYFVMARPSRTPGTGSLET